ALWHEDPQVDPERPLDRRARVLGLAVGPGERRQRAADAVILRVGDVVLHVELHLAVAVRGRGLEELLLRARVVAAEVEGRRDGLRDQAELPDAPLPARAGGW